MINLRLFFIPVYNTRLFTLYTSDFFIDRPKFAFVIAIIIVIAGLISIASLPVAQYPEITPPQVSISVMYPGANAETVMKTVVEPIEARVNGVEDMIYMSSQASNNGMAQITVSFKIGSGSLYLL